MERPSCRTDVFRRSNCWDETLWRLLKSLAPFLESAVGQDIRSEVQRLLKYIAKMCFDDTELSLGDWDHFGPVIGDDDFCASVFARAARGPPGSVGKWVHLFAFSFRSVRRVGTIPRYRERRSHLSMNRHAPYSRVDSRRHLSILTVP